MRPNSKPETRISEIPEKSFKEKRIRDITLVYYSREDIRKAMFQFSKNRECIPRYFEGFGKRFLLIAQARGRNMRLGY